MVGSEVISVMSTIGSGVMSNNIVSVVHWDAVVGQDIISMMSCVVVTLMGGEISMVSKDIISVMGSIVFSMEFTVWGIVSIGLIGMMSSITVVVMWSVDVILLLLNLLCYFVMWGLVVDWGSSVVVWGSGMSNSVSWHGVVGWVNMSVCMNSWGVFDFSLTVDLGIGVDTLLISMGFWSFVVWVIVMNWVVTGMNIWVMGIIVVLHPFVGVYKLVLVIIESMVVLVSFESMILPVIREHSAVISMGLKLMVIISVISLEVVWASMGVEIWNSVILINNMSISMSIVVIPSMFWDMVVVIMSLVMSIFMSIAVVSVPGSVFSFVMVVDWSKVTVVVVGLMSVVLNLLWLVHSSVLPESMVAISFMVFSSPWKVMSLKSVELIMLGGESFMVTNFTNNW